MLVFTLFRKELNIEPAGKAVFGEIHIGEGRGNNRS